MGRTRTVTRMEDLLDLDIRRVIRAVGDFKVGKAFGWQWWRGDRLRAAVTIRCEEGGVRLLRNVDGARAITVVPIVTTPCHLGGHRAWWSCPECRRRVAVLYAGQTFACRHCHQLAYSSQLETRGDRAIRQAERVRRRLGWVPGIAHGAGPRPKGMHDATFRRLSRRQMRFAGAALGVLSDWLVDRRGWRG